MLTPEQELRLLLGERIPDGGSEIDTMFRDEELSVILNQHEDQLRHAAAHGWAIKAAELAELIDITEEGSDRKLSQRYRHALTQMQYYADLIAADTDALLEAARGAVVARSARWATPASEELPSHESATESSPWDDGKARHVRPYPLKRFNQIKR